MCGEGAVFMELQRLCGTKPLVGGVFSVAARGLTMGCIGLSPKMSCHTLVWLILCCRVDRLWRILTNPTSGGGVTRLSSTSTWRGEGRGDWSLPPLGMGWRVTAVALTVLLP